jgi:hypothetical protein
MAPSFAADHTCPVPIDGRYRGSPAIRWVVQIRPGGAWTPWQWSDRLRNWRRPTHGGDGGAPPISLLGIVVTRLFALLLAAPPKLFRTAKYRLGHRHDWDVIVYCGEDEKRNRALVESHASQEVAVARAEELWQHLDEHDELPDQSVLT